LAENISLLMLYAFRRLTYFSSQNNQKQQECSLTSRRGEGLWKTTARRLLTQNTDSKFRGGPFARPEQKYYFRSFFITVQILKPEDKERTYADVNAYIVTMLILTLDRVLDNWIF
jgi:hypothetical protein